MILIVDDMDINREILAEMLEADYDILQADNGDEALKVIEENKDKLRLILLDLIMPKLDGFGVLSRLKELGLVGRIPVIVISGDSDVGIQVKSFEYGVSDFVSKPFDEEIVHKRVDNIVSLFEYQNRLEERVAAQTKQLRSQYGILEKQAKKLKEQNIKIIDILGNVVESRNLESGEHIKRVKGFTRILARRLMEDYPAYGLDEHTVEMISEASALHDIGKIAIPDNVLLKPGKLTEEEYELMKSHTTRGCDILDGIQGIWEDEYRKTSYDICRHHHERYDGKGYPDKLKGEDIPISAQIVSVADVYDALVSERVYKAAYSKEEAFHMIIKGECGMFSPRLLESFRNARKAFEDFVDEGARKNNQ
jgi:putative two-component system response regulator